MNEHFLKQSNGLVWHFTHNGSNGLCFCKMQDENIRDYEILMQNALADYDVTIDEDNLPTGVTVERKYKDDTP